MGSDQQLPEVRELLWALAAEEATSEQKRRLNCLLRDSEPLRIAAARHLMDDVNLRAVSQELMVTDVYSDSRLLPGTHHSPSVNGRLAFRKIVAAVAGLAACIAIAGFYSWTRTTVDAPSAQAPRAEDCSEDTLQPKTTAPPINPRFAVLTQSVDITWRSPERKPGYLVGVERLAIDKGLLQLEFFSGATVVVQGPAELELESSWRAVCSRGKARVLVPPQARGFTLSTPGREVVDLGTEFAVHVDERGQSDVHVLDGEVSLAKKSLHQENQIQLLAGKSARYGPGTGAELTIAATPEQVVDLFVSSRQLSAIAADGGQARYLTWARYAESWASDPATIFYSRFDQGSDWSRILPAYSTVSNHSVDGAVVGARWSDGRWHNKSALEFTGAGDRVRVELPGEYDSVSFFAWVRINKIAEDRNALLLTDGWEPGELHWQIGNRGQLLLGVSDRFGETNLPGVEAFKGPDYESPPVFGFEDMGRWVCVATVFDAERREARHYFDGRRVSSEKLKTQLRKVRFGTAEIGNWTPSTQKHFLTRGLHGSIDELAVLARVLTDDEIEVVYRYGKPQASTTVDHQEQL